MTESTADNRFSILGCVGLFIFECIYILLWYHPEPSRTDPGIILILAAECSYMLKIARANVRQKHEQGKTSRTAMLYTRVFGLSLLGVMAVSAGLLQVDSYKSVWILAFALTAFGKIMWERQDQTGPAAAT